MSAIEAIRAERIVAVLRRVSEPDRVVAALRKGGIRIVEITFDSDDATGAIADLRREPELVVLAGTIRTAEDADAAAEAGAQACVSPTLVPEVLQRCQELGLPAIPGALTATEVETAWRLGAAMVKLFPASLGGPEYVSQLGAPLRAIPLLASGGVDAANAAAFLRAGADAVAVGSALTAARDPAAAARDLVGSVRDA
jgi:2-dehydro-3-deoxyphosphogluconate aldolase/(4S)-4-hydroxy-2-oxoglutarate aldolase